MCARALSVHAVIGGTCLLAPSGSTHFLRRVSARALSVHAIQSVSIFPRPHATHPDRGRDEILLILPPIDPHPLVPTPCRQKMADSLFPQGRHMAWSSGARPRQTDRQTQTDSSASGAGPSRGSRSSGGLAPLHSLDPVSFQPMSDLNFSTWRLGLHRQLANAAVIEPPLLEQLDGAWEQAHSAFESTGANSLQFISYIERKFPYEFNLLVSPLFFSFTLN